MKAIRNLKTVFDFALRLRQFWGHYQPTLRPSRRATTIKTVKRFGIGARTTTIQSVGMTLRRFLKTKSWPKSCERHHPVYRSNGVRIS